MKRFVRGVAAAGVVTTMSVALPVMVGEAWLPPVAAEGGCPAGMSPYGSGVTGGGRAYMECRGGGNSAILWLD